MPNVATKIIQASGLDGNPDSYVVANEKFLVAVVVSSNPATDGEVSLGVNSMLGDLTINPPDQSIVLRFFNATSAAIGCRIPLKKGQLITLFRGGAGAYVAVNLCFES